MTEQKFFSSDDFLALLRPTKAVDTLTPQLCKGLDLNKLGSSFGLNLLLDRTKSSLSVSLLSYRDEVLELIESHSLPATTLGTTLVESFDTEALLQPGLAAMKFSTDNGSFFSHIKGRVKTDHFSPTPSQLADLKHFKDDSGFDVSLHYIQTTMAIDIDFKDPSGQKLAVSSIAQKPIKGDSKTFLQYMNGVLKSFDASIHRHLLAIWFTQSGLRLVFTHEPFETFSTSSVPLDASIKSSTELPLVYLGLSKSILGSYFKDIDFEDGTKLHFEMDTDSTKSAFALSRLAKVKKAAADTRIDLRSTKVVVFDQAVPMMESEPLFQQALALGKALSIKSATLGGDVDSEFKVPEKFESEVDKVEFASNFVQSFADHPILAVYSKSPTMPYEAWRQILTSFRRARQVLDKLGCHDQAKKICDMAHRWSKASAGYTSHAHYLIDGILADTHEACYGWESIHHAMGTTYEAWMQSTPEAKKLHCQDEMGLTQSIFSTTWAKTFKGFKSTKGYSPMVGRNPLPKQAPAPMGLVIGRPFLDAEGKPISWASLTVELAQKILRTDPLLPTILHFDVIRQLKIITPNFSEVLADALDGKYTQPIADKLAWRAIDDGSLSMLRVYLKVVYCIKSEPTKEHLENLFDLLSDTSTRRLEHYQINPLYAAVKSRYDDFVAFRARYEKFCGVGADQVLDLWLPSMLCIDPTLSDLHKEFFNRAKAIGRKLAIGLAQRVCSTDTSSVFEQILVIKSRMQGGGKTQLSKSLVSSLLRPYDSKDVSSFGGMIGIEEFIAESNGSIPSEKDGIVDTFGKVVNLLDDFDKKFLTASGGGDLKRYLSQTRDTVRRVYARHATTKNRNFITVATTNVNHILSDESGSRRFWILDLDSVSEDGFYLCDLLDRESLVPRRREVTADGNPGFINMKMAGMLSLAIGAAFEVGVLGENLTPLMCMDGTTASVSDIIQSHYKLDMTSKLGMHLLDERISVERPYLHHRDALAIEEYHQRTFSLAILGVDDHKKSMQSFLESNESFGGLGARTEFELSELKTFLKSQSNNSQLQLPSDHAVKLWASQGIKSKSDDQLYYITSRRVESKGLRRTVWFIVDAMGQRVVKNPFNSQKPSQTSVRPIEISVQKIDRAQNLMTQF